MAGTTLRKPFENFLDSVLYMATSTESLQERIVGAYSNSFGFVDEEVLPKGIREKFEELRRKLTSAKPEGDEGLVPATARRLGNEEADDIIRKIIHLAFEVHSEFIKN